VVTRARYAPERGDVIWLSFDPRIGHEQAGHRLALTISPRSYNAKVGLGLFCPVTSQVKGYPFEVAFPTGCNTSGVVLADQVKSLDWRARRAKLFERAPAEVIAEALGKIRALVQG
jgi:mRNA interferase MazF